MAANFRYKGDILIFVHIEDCTTTKSKPTCIDLGCFVYRILFCLTFYFEGNNINAMYDIECKAIAATQTICIAMIYVLVSMLIKCYGTQVRASSQMVIKGCGTLSKS